MHIINDNFFMNISLDIVDKPVCLIHISHKNGQCITLYIFGGLLYPSVYSHFCL